MMMVPWLWSLASAGGWVPSGSGGVPLEFPAVAVQLLEINGAKRVVVGTEQSVELVDPVAGEVIASVPFGGEAIVAIEGTHNIALCAETGLLVLGIGRTGFTSSDVVTDERCRALYSYEDAAGRGVLVAAGESISIWTHDGGKYTGPARFGRSLGSLDGPRRLLAGFGDRWVVGLAGDDEILERSSRGRSSIATGGGMAGVASYGGGWAWSVPEGSIIATSDHRELAVGPEPVALYAVDLGGSDNRQLLVQHADGLSLLDGEETRWLAQGSIRDARAGDINSDGCADIVLADAEQGLRWLTGQCALGRQSGRALVELTNGARLVWLRGADGMQPTGLVAPGQYTIQAWFGTPDVVTAGRMVVREGDHFEIHCVREMLVCKAERRLKAEQP